MDNIECLLAVVDASNKLNLKLDKLELSLVNQLKEAKINLAKSEKSSRKSVAVKAADRETFNRTQIRIQNDFLCHSLHIYLTKDIKNESDLFMGFIKLMVTVGGDFDLVSIRVFLKIFFEQFEARVKANAEHYFSFHRLLAIKKENNFDDDWLNAQVVAHQAVHKRLHLSHSYHVVKTDG